jgi:ATP-binding cassette subfamily B protein
MFAIYGFIAYQTLHGRISLGDLVLYYQAFQRGQGFLKGMLGNLAQLYEESLFLSNLYEFLDLQPTVVEPAIPVPVPRLRQQGIVFDAVNFRYPGSVENVLEDVSLYVNPGEKIALVGENGAGKSTLIKLLCRLYDPIQGAISFDGIALRDFQTSDLRREISVLFQDYSHYNLSACENIWFGNVQLPPDHEKIQIASFRAGADTIIRKLPKGYDSILGKWFDEGEELSGGEWQKIALARAFLREAQIVVLDEPTSSLDAKAEYELFTRFRELAREQTAILISHRFSTVRMADRIYVLDKGCIVEHGSHDELLRYDGMYAELFHTQAQHYR